MTPEAVKQYILSWKQAEVTRELIESNFAKHFDMKARKVVDGKMRWDTEFALKKGEYSNKEAIPRTNAGLLVFNKFVIENLLEKVLGYWNEPLTDKVLGKMEEKINKAVEMDEITTDDYAEYQDRLQWLLAIHTEVCASFTKKSIKNLPSIVKKRDKLFKENVSELKKGNAVVALKIEKELVEDARKELKGDPGMDLYNSGARGSFENNYKNIAIMKGPIYDPIGDRFKNVQSSFLEGIEKDDIPEFASTVVMGAYPKAVGTQVGGYTVKRFYAAFQNIVLDKKGSDCGSKGTLLVQVTKDNKLDCMYRYIVEGSKIVRLDESNIGKYMGKTVRMRSAMYCTTSKRCNKCMGDKPYMVGIENVGLTAGKIGSNYVNLSMKSFHDTTMKLGEIKADNIFL